MFSWNRNFFSLRYRSRFLLDPRIRYIMKRNRPYLDKLCDQSVMIEITFYSFALETRNVDKFHASIIDKDLIYEFYDLYFDNSILSFFYEFSCAVHVPDDKMINSMITLYDSWLTYHSRFSSKSSLFLMKVCWNPKGGRKSCFLWRRRPSLRSTTSSHKHGTI